VVQDPTDVTDDKKKEFFLQNLLINKMFGDEIIETDVNSEGYLFALVINSVSVHRHSISHLKK
jgi:hypothetical protein